MLIKIDPALKVYPNFEQNLLGHWQDATSKYPENLIIGVFCQGSQNYELEDAESDLDTKCLVVPSIKSLYTGKETVRPYSTYIRNNAEHIVMVDIRTFFEHLKRGSSNYIELLYSKAAIINPTYQVLWETLVAKREELAHQDPSQVIKSLNQMIQDKFQNLLRGRSFPSRSNILLTYGYDPKELSHLIRAYYLLVDYIAGKSFADCLVGTPVHRDYLKQLKRYPSYSADEAIALGQRYAEEAAEITKVYGKSAKINLQTDFIETYLEDFIIKSIEFELEKRRSREIDYGNTIFKQFTDQQTV